MEKNTDILHEAKRLRLLAAALELQHYTSTAANVVPIPGGDHVIVIGTPAEVAQLLDIAPLPAELPAVLFDGHAVYHEVMANDPNAPRPTADNVADVFDAVVRLLRRAALQQLVDQAQELGAYEVAGTTDSDGGHHD
jgi:hypothetical protein